MEFRRLLTVNTENLPETLQPSRFQMYSFISFREVRHVVWEAHGLYTPSSMTEHWRSNTSHHPFCSTDVELDATGCLRPQSLHCWKIFCPSGFNWTQISCTLHLPLGFRAKSSTVYTIFSLHQLQEKCHEDQMPLYIYRSSNSQICSNFLIGNIFLCY